MMSDLSCRMFLGACASLFVPASETVAQNQRLISDVERLLEHLRQQVPAAEDEQYFDPALLPPPEAKTDFPIEHVKLSDIAPHNRPQVLNFEGDEPLGSLVVDANKRFLYHVLAYGQARRYGVGVGRAGFAWASAAQDSPGRASPQSA